MDTAITKLLAKLVESASDEIDKLDRTSSNDDVECGVIEGKISALRSRVQLYSKLLADEAG